MTGEFEQVATIYPIAGEPVAVGVITCGDGRFICLEQGQDAIHLPLRWPEMHTLANALKGCEISGQLRSDIEEEELEEVAA